MQFLKIRASNFRNLVDFELDLDARQVFLIGNNGQGKTNFIELIYYLCFGSSFRTNVSKRIIKEGFNIGMLNGIFIDDDKIKREISVTLFSNKHKEIKLDSKMINDRKKLIENISCIVFTHDDMSFVDGPPEKKRWFMNQTISLIDPDFIDIIRMYNKILKNRNILFKQKQYDMFELYDEKLAEYGLIIKKKRSELVDEFNVTFTSLYEYITGKNNTVKIYYKPSWDSFETNDILNKLKKNYDKDSFYGTTTTGPHRDTFDYISGKHNFVHFGSTGQLRLVSLVLRVAQLKYVIQKTGKRPIILLDDVLLELDPGRRAGFLNLLMDYEQAFFTFLPDSNYKNYEKYYTNKYLIEMGGISEWKEPGMC
jgi:DNA replication and repair protein RecF